MRSRNLLIGKSSISRKGDKLNKYFVDRVRIRKLLIAALIAGFFQPIGASIIFNIAPSAIAATTYNPADATTLTIPTGVETVTGTLIGGGGGNGATDGAGNTLRVPSGRGQVDFSFRPTANTVIGIYPGNAGQSGATGTSTPGGSNGTDTDPNQNFAGGGGGRSGGSGSSGSGGGGGAASVLYIAGNVAAVAGGAGGGGGSANVAGSGSDGSSTHVANNTNLNGGVGVPMSTACNESNDGGGGGGGGGGYYGGNGGSLISHTSECSGNGGTKGAEYVRANTFSSSSISLNTSANTSNGSISLTMYLSVPANITASGGINSIAVNWDVAAAARSFKARLYNAAGTTLLATIDVSAGTYTTTFTNADYAAIATNTLYTVTVTAIGNSGTPYESSNESAKLIVSTTTPTETDTAISLNGATNQALWAASHSSLQFNETFTAQAWIQPTGFNCQYYATASSTGADQFCHIVGKGNYFSLVVGSDSNTQFKNRLGVIWGGTIAFSSYVVKPNEWHHVAFSRFGSGTGQAALYVDGSLVETVTAGANSANTTRDFTVGSNRSDQISVEYSYGKFLGLIDEVKISKVARTQSQIQSDAHTHKTDSTFQLYYDFNETSGNRIFNRALGAISATDLAVSTGNGVFDSSSIWTSETVGPYTVVKFKRSYLVNSNGWTTPSNVSSIRFLAVGGGGGGGGGFNGGGGGAGGVRETNTAVSPNTVYNVVIGLPGLGAIESYTNTSGGSTIFRIESSQTELFKASGGGRGATEQQTMGGPNGNPAGSESGGSGGGGSHGGGVNVNGSSGNIGAFTPVEGYAGGNGYSAAGFYVGGGGGGAGGAGGSATSSTPGVGGIGISSFITGSELKIGGGGGGAGRLNLSGEKVFTASGNATLFGGGSGFCTSACTTVDTGTAGSANTGGGGGAGAASAGRAYGGSGGSGFLVIKYITDSPSIILQPINDTSTVGTTNVFKTITSVAPSPLTKSIYWQFTSDTTTVLEASISGWTNISSGSGFTTDTFTTTILTKAMNKYRFRAIVTFSDTSTISSSITSSIVTLTVNDAISITSSTSTITRKYGSAQSVRAIAYSGGTTSTGAIGTSTSHTVQTPFGALAGGKVYVDTATSTAYFKADTGTAVGTYVETITVTDFKGAVTTFTQTVVVTPADTLTVTIATPNALTYTGSAAAISPSITVSGLVSGDSATGATFNYSRAPNCASGGACQVGEIGPAGGKIFYVSASAINAVSGISSGGIYLEMAPASFSKTAYNWCEGAGNPYTTLFGATGTSIGSGAANTKIMTDNCTGGAGFEAVNLTLGGKSDWFLPSSGELVEIYSQRTTLGLGTGKSASKYLYWASTETENWIASSLVPWAGVGGQNKAQATPYLPIRAFSPTSTTFETATASPTNAGKYRITASGLTLSGGISTDNYVSTIYETATLTINKATQTAFTNHSPLSGVLGSALPILKFGGSGDGAESIETTNDSASGCTLNGILLSATTAGNCLVSATKESSENYLQYDSLFYVYMYYYVPEPAAPVSTTPTQIAIATTNAWSASATVGPTITGISPSSGPVGTVVTFTGTGFDGVNVIKIGRKDLTSVTGVNSTTVTGVIPAGAATGPILMSNSAGQDFNAGGFTVTGP
jgi:hypothetical protein